MVTASSGTMEINNLPSANVIYVAMRGFGNMNVTLSTTSVNVIRKIYTKENVTFEDGKYYAITVKTQNQDYFARITENQSFNN